MLLFGSSKVDQFVLVWRKFYSMSACLVQAALVDSAKHGTVLFYTFAICEKIQVVYKLYSVNPEVWPTSQTKEPFDIKQKENWE